MPRKKNKQNILTFVLLISQNNDGEVCEEKIKVYIAGIVQKIGETKTETSNTLVPILLKFVHCMESSEEQVRYKGHCVIVSCMHIYIEHS
jgi:hypothetical protein